VGRIERGLASRLLVDRTNRRERSQRHGPGAPRVAHADRAERSGIRNGRTGANRQPLLTAHERARHVRHVRGSDRVGHVAHAEPARRQPLRIERDLVRDPSPPERGQASEAGRPRERRDERGVDAPAEFGLRHGFRRERVGHDWLRFGAFDQRRQIRDREARAGAVECGADRSQIVVRIARGIEIEFEFEFTGIGVRARGAQSRQRRDGGLERQPDRGPHVLGREIARVGEDLDAGECDVRKDALGSGCDRDPSHDESARDRKENEPRPPPEHVVPDPPASA
jgi:hypothetical protein